CQQGDGKPITF
nr:immunoglobulin light chain junction region [Macaca mulatta]MOX48162.1 immunoglobulin light chain junction region [Macaca mulatta]MOX48350.1 immunoglobulin light chain junction region [Macaca mulatta]MOX48389.1 immunoglobulin light chain junction region [Macaca mulatta]MOX48420.1 immunoglobulin light chain junction region [Macaca mulatta]